MAHAKRNRNNKQVAGDENRFTVRGVRRDPVDISKLSKALIGLAQAEAEREAQAEHTARAVGNVGPEITSKGNARPGGGDDA